MLGGSDNFQWIDRDGVVLIVCLVIGAAVALFVPLTVPEPKSDPPPAPQARPICAITISQYGPGERWYSPSSKHATCARAAGVVPNHILSMPLAEAK